MPIPPPELQHLQSLFYEAIATRDTQSIDDLSEHIQGNDNLSYEQGLSAYQGSLLGKLSRALEEIFPVCCQLVGEAFFVAMARKYIRQTPSRSPDLGDYGAEFPDFIASFEPAASLPYLPDVARLEWYWHRAFNSPEQSRLDISTLGQVPPEQWETLIFQLPQDSTLMSSQYPVHRIWQVHQSAQDEPDPINLDQGGVNMFIWRDRTDTRIDLPNQDEWLFLSALASGHNFGLICEMITNTMPDVDIAQQLPVWVQRGWIVGFTVPNAS